MRSTKTNCATAVARLRNDNAQNEYYLTDTVEDFVRGGKRVVPVMAGDHLHVLGINDRVELAQARKEMNKRLSAKYMRDGVTIIDPDATYLEPELRIGRDTVIYPNSTIGRLSEIGEGCVIGPNARLSGVSSAIGSRCARALFWTANWAATSRWDRSRICAAIRCWQTACTSGISSR